MGECVAPFVIVETTTGAEMPALQSAGFPKTDLKLFLAEGPAATVGHFGIACARNLGEGTLGSGRRKRVY